MFEKESRQIIDSLKAQNAAKVWLIVGSKGIGKKAFAKSLAYTLTHNANDYNPNVKWIECGLTDVAKREIQKALLAGEVLTDKEWSKKTEITVDDVRDGCHFLSLKSDKIKILIFNLADEMNGNAQNALLKTLEEPYPNTLILLLCENVGHLFPTILSRCQKIHLMPLDRASFCEKLKAKHDNLDEMELAEIAELSDCSLGVAEEILSLNALETYHILLNLLEKESDLEIASFFEFCEAVARSKELFALTQRFILKIIVKKTKEATQFSLEKGYKLSKTYETVQELLTQIATLNLDKKQTLVSIIHQIREAL